LNTATAEESDFASVQIKCPEDILVENNIPVILQGTGSSAYINSPPDEIIIDGAFGDWSHVEKISDDDSEPVSNPNVDASKYAIVESEDTLSFYLKVMGSMLAGTELLDEPYVYHEPKPSSNRVIGGTNTEHPLPDLPVKTGEDSIYIFLDYDSDQSTGYRPDDVFPIGAEYMVELKGQNGNIEVQRLMNFTGNSQKGFSWAERSNIPAACAGSELETAVSLDLICPTTKMSMALNQEGLGIYIHIVDWSGEGDDVEYTYNVEPNVDKLDDIAKTDYLLIRNALSRSSEIIFTFNDFEHTQPKTKFNHGDTVYVTISNEKDKGGILPAMIIDTDISEIPENQIRVLVYDDGTHNDKCANDGVYSGYFQIQSISAGGFTDDESDAIAVTNSVSIRLGSTEFYIPDSGVIAPIHSPEFSDVLIILPIVFILILITCARNNKTQAKGYCYSEKSSMGVGRK